MNTYTLFFRLSGAIGLPTIRITASSSNDALEYAQIHGWELMPNPVSGSDNVDTVIELRGA